jgi:hypothetical protein
VAKRRCGDEAPTLTLKTTGLSVLLRKSRVRSRVLPVTTASRRPKKVRRW